MAKTKRDNKTFKFVLGKRIARYRNQNTDFTQADLANIVGVTPVQIHNYETGVVMPPVDILYRIAKALYVSIDVLTGTDSIEGAEIFKALHVYDETFKKYVKNNKECEISDITPKVEKINKDLTANFAYNFEANLVGIDPTQLFVVILSRYNECLKAPAGSIVLIEEARENLEFLKDQKPITVLMDGNIDIDGDKKETMSFFTKLSPASKSGNVLFTENDELTHRWIFNFPLSESEKIIHEKYLKHLVVGIVKKVIIDY